MPLAAETRCVAGNYKNVRYRRSYPLEEEEPHGLLSPRQYRIYHYSTHLIYCQTAGSRSAFNPRIIGILPHQHCPLRGHHCHQRLTLSGKYRGGNPADAKALGGRVTSGYLQVSNSVPRWARRGG